MKKLIPVLMIPLLLTACSGGEKEASKDVLAMDTVMTLSVYGDGAESALEEAEAEIYRLEDLFSIADENSEISAINLNGGGSLSEDTRKVMAAALEISGRTGGAFDVSVAPLVRAWGFVGGEYRVPSDEEINELLKNVGWERIGLSGSELTLPEGMSVDLGGIAKGYTGQRLSDMLKEMGVSSAMLSLGGNVQAVGSRPDGGDWRVAIQDPDDEAGYLGVLEVSDAAVVTSGGYERYFDQDGVRYHHILDPKTGRPSDSGLKSVTIVCSDGTLADGLSTALFVLGLDEALEQWRESEDFECVLVTDGDEVYVTEGLTYSSDSPWQVVIR